MTYDRDALLNALQRTSAVEVRAHTPLEGTNAPVQDSEALRTRLAQAEGALSALSSAAERYYKEHKIKTDDLKDGFEVSYTQFMKAGEERAEYEALIARITSLTEERSRLTAERDRAQRTALGAMPYEKVKLPRARFGESAHTLVRLGTVALAVKEAFCAAFSALPLAAEAGYVAGDRFVCAAAFHKSVSEEAEGVLSAYSFQPAPDFGEETGEEYVLSTQRAVLELDERLIENENEIAGLLPKVRPLKVYCDYLGYELEKSELSGELLQTERTFLLEAYVPAGAEEAVRGAIEEVTQAAYLDYEDVPEDEIPPTLLKNNPVVDNFEAITNMYTPPNAREFDPNTVMAFFYSLFMGFIMADIGYGLLMAVGGAFLCLRIKRKGTGLKRLSGVFAVSGVFTIIWGFLFNSFFGMSFAGLPTVMPDSMDARWTIAGIQIPSVLVIALEIGVLQLFTGYVCKIVQCWRRKQILDGIFDGLVWAIFSLGVGLAIAGLVKEANISILATVGGITAGVTLVIAILTAGRKEKILGKFTKGFGTAYGVINYASDILSYARLYGLMLSGAVIAQIISQYCIGADVVIGGSVAPTGFLFSGNVLFIVLGVILLVGGNLFNLAIGLLGAYIHVARLQYVEFYSRFYEGEGELFAPLGSKHKYVYLAPLGAGAGKKNVSA